MNIQRMAAVLIFLAGISHLTVQAYEHMNMHFYLIGFLMTGLIQILLGIILWKRKTLKTSTFWIATLVNGGAFIFWLLTRTMQAPFMEGIEHFTIIGGSIATLQIVSIILLLIKRKRLLHSIYVIIGSTLLGFASHFGAMHLEAHFPEMKVAGHHGSDCDKESCTLSDNTGTMKANSMMNHDMPMKHDDGHVDHQ